MQLGGDAQRVTLQAAARRAALPARLAMGPPRPRALLAGVGLAIGVSGVGRTGGGEASDDSAGCRTAGDGGRASGAH